MLRKMISKPMMAYGVVFAAVAVKEKESSPTISAAANQPLKIKPSDLPVYSHPDDKK